jgi:TP901-1 family phage major tail protein
LAKGKSKDARVMVDVGEAPTEFGEVKDWDFSVDKKTIDATSTTDDWEVVEHGSKSWSGSITVFYDPEDAVQSAIETSILTGDTDVAVTLRPQGTGVGKKEYAGDAVVTSWKPAGAKDDMVGMSLELKGNGALTPGTQSAG